MSPLSSLLLNAALLGTAATASPADAERAAAARWQAEQLRVLRSRDLDPMRSPDRVETFALEDVFGERVAPSPNAILVATDLPGRFAALPERTPVSAEAGQELAHLFLDPASYEPWMSACLFSPGVGVRFHQKNRAVDAFICFQCREIAFQVVGKKRSLLKWSFGTVSDRLLELVQKVRPDDERLGRVRKAWDEEEERARANAAAEARWREAMPSSLRPYWDQMNGIPAFDERGIGMLAQVLAADVADAQQRVLILLQWLGSGDGPWSGYPAYESVAEDLLLTFSTADILEAIRGRDLTPEQTEGAARLFAGWDFTQQRRGDQALLGHELRQRLLDHSLQSTDKDKRARAERAFQTP